MAPRTKYDWDSVNWRLPNREIAQLLGCPYDTVAERRSKYRHGPAVRRSIRRDKGSRRGANWHRAPPELQIIATAAAQASPKSGRYVTNVHAKSWLLTDPQGRRHEIVNLYHFVRQNPGLFRPQDIIWKRTGGGRRGTGGEYCNATAGLFNVSRGRAKKWKGWTLAHSESE